MFTKTNVMTYQAIKQPLLKAFISVLLIVALVSSVSEWLIQHTLITISSNANIINIAGRQRMLSQNISKNLVLLASPKFIQNRSSIFQTLKTAVTQLVDNHQQLFIDKHAFYADKNLFSINKNNNEIEKLYQILQPSFVQIKKATYKLLANHKLMQLQILTEEQQVLITTVLANEAKFLHTMDAIVAQYSQNTENEVTNIRNINWLLYVVWLVALLLIGIYVLRPTIKTIALLFDKIKEEEQALSSTSHQLMIL